MKLHSLVLGAIDAKRDPDAELFDALPTGRMIVALGDDHVPSVARASLQVPPGRCVLFDRRDDLEELVPDREERVLEPEGLHPRIHVADLEAEDGLQILDGGCELLGN